MADEVKWTTGCRATYCGIMQARRGQEVEVVLKTAAFDIEPRRHLRRQED